MNNNLDKTIELEQEYRRLLRYLRKKKEAEDNEKVDDNQIDCDQPE
jgi:ribosomal protein S15P/S13E